MREDYRLPLALRARPVHGHGRWSPSPSKTAPATTPMIWFASFRRDSVPPARSFRALVEACASLSSPPRSDPAAAQRSVVRLAHHARTTIARRAARSTAGEGWSSLSRRRGGIRCGVLRGSSSTRPLTFAARTTKTWTMRFSCPSATSLVGQKTSCSDTADLLPRSSPICGDAFQWLDAGALKKRGARGITGHSDVSRAFGGTHWDPGPNFPIEFYLALVGAS